MDKWIQKLKKKPYHQNPLIPEEIKDFMDIEDHPKFFQDNWSNHTTQYFTQGDYGEDLGWKSTNSRIYQIDGTKYVINVKYLDVNYLT